MNLALRKPMTLAEFLEWEERQPLRYEFDGVGPVAMTAERPGMHKSKGIVAFALTARPAASACPFLAATSNFRSRRATSAIPTAWCCTPVDGGATVVYDPVVVFEVLSPMTSYNDRIVKAREYETTPSVQPYVVLEQESVNAVVNVRSGEAWTHDILVADSIFALPEIGINLPLAELYEGIGFGED